MKAIVCKAWGPPESLVIEDLAPLVAPPGKVVVSVKAASVKFSDTLLIQNKYQTKPELPFIPGGEVTGVLKSIGPGVDGWKIGDRVSAQTTYGGYAEEVVAEPERQQFLIGRFLERDRPVVNIRHLLLRAHRSWSTSRG
jgi:NADPH2:quinone reductase